MCKFDRENKSYETQFGMNKKCWSLPVAFYDMSGMAFYTAANISNKQCKHCFSDSNTGNRYSAHRI